MKIFCIGVNKTGTVSLSKAIDQLGMKPLHDYVQAKEICDSIARRRKHPVVEEYDAFLDGPYVNHFKQIYRMYPDAKYIFTTRSMSGWINSRIIHVLYNRILLPEHNWNNCATKMWERQYERTHTNIRKFFKNKENFLEMNIMDGDGWDKLCPFLGVDIPDSPFPHGNKGQWRLREILKKLEEHGSSEIPKLEPTNSHG